MRSGNPERGRLSFTVGFPHSGKSTVCNAWMARPGPRPRAVVGGDDFRHALYGKEYDPELEGPVFAAMDVAIRALLYRGFDVMVDETCTTESTLLRYLRIDPDASPVFVDTPADVCVERAMANGREFLVVPIRRMEAQLARLRANWLDTVEKLRRMVLERRGLDVVVP